MYKEKYKYNYNRQYDYIVMYISIYDHFRIMKYDKNAIILTDAFVIDEDVNLYHDIEPFNNVEDAIKYLHGHIDYII